jgi:hypothetical protein
MSTVDRRRRLGSALLTVGVAIVALAGVVSARVGGVQEAPFPHPAHEGLFPVCSGCHVEAADGTPGFPAAALCARCHDGVDLAPVSWSGPTGVPSNLRFDHGAHQAGLEAAGEPAETCASCHTAPGTGRMAIEDRVREDTCFACHAHASEDHFQGDLSGPDGSPSGSGGACATCHLPLAATRFPVGRIASLPVPADHLDGAFVPSTHGAAATATPTRCATCHTEQRCLACHVDVGNPVIARIPAAPPELELPRAAAAYPVPASHRRDLWAERHSPVPEAASCNTCHTRDDCTACHVSPTPAVFEGLPLRASVSAPGVGLGASPPPSHASPFFHEAHATLAAADDGGCATCHTVSYCSDCHDGPATGGYHPTGFVGAHAAVAFGRVDECASCHETAVFCRSCHVDSGLGTSGRLEAGYHDAEPVWLLRHGQAARQNLESCASCHQQRDCVQCHGALGSFKVSPHQPGFDAAAAWARSPRTCLACHVGNPLGGA